MGIDECACMNDVLSSANDMKITFMKNEYDEEIDTCDNIRYDDMYMIDEVEKVKEILVQHFEK